MAELDLITQEAQASIPKLRERVVQAMEGSSPSRIYEVLQKELEKPVLALIEKWYGDSARKEVRCYFHRSEHTVNVMHSTERILRAYQDICREQQCSEHISEKDIAMAKFSALCHDVIQKFDIVLNPQTGVREKKSLWGKNEEENWAFIESILQDIRSSLGGGGVEYITDGDIEKIRTIFFGTEPTFDLKRKTVMQPKLHQGKTLLERSLGLADLGSSGISAERFLQDGNRLFRERMLWIEELFDQCIAQNRTLTESERETIRNAIISWQQIQVEFATSRYEQHAYELSGLTDAEVQAVGRVFSDQAYQESIAISRERLAASQTGELNILLQDVFEYPGDMIQKVCPR